jgi:hypothetical protein
MEQKKLKNWKSCMERLIEPEVPHALYFNFLFR